MNARIAIISGLCSLLFFVGDAIAGERCIDWRSGPLASNVSTFGIGYELLSCTTWDPDGVGPATPVLVVAGDLGESDFAANGIASYDATIGQWTALGYTNGAPNSLIVFNNELIAGGYFISVGAQAMNHIMRYNGSSWQSLGIGTQHDVHSLGIYNSELTVGSAWLPNDGQPYDLLSRWSAGGGWAPVPNLPDALFIFTLGAFQNEIIAGGWFSGGIKRWNPVNGWRSMGGNANGHVRAQTIFNGQLIAGGEFSQINGSDANHVATWNGISWSALGAGTPFIVKALAVYNGELYAGGEPTNQSSGANSAIARWNGSSWVAMGTGITNGLVNGLTVYNNELVAVGQFDIVGGVLANNVARWNGSAWLPIGIVNTATGVFSMTPFHGGLVAGGDFHQSTIANQQANDIALYDGVALTPFSSGMNGRVNALTSFTYSGVNGDDELVAGGAFTTAGGTAVNYVARWDVNPTAAFPPPHWQAMGAGLNNTVTALTRFNGSTIAAGYFTASGATPCNSMARWNQANSTWGPLHTGMNGPVLAMRGFTNTVNTVRLVAGGIFTTASGNACSNIASWIESTETMSNPTWQPLGAGLNGQVNAVEYYNGSFYAGGEFSASGATPVNRIARWNGSAWVQVGNGIGFNNSVYALKTVNGYLYAGGNFTTVDGITARRMARWNGSVWEEVQGGADDFVFALGSYHDELHAGGWFRHVKAGALYAPCWAKYHLTGVPWIAYQPSSQSLACGGNAHFVAYPSVGYFGLSHEWRKDGVPIQVGPTGTGSRIEDLGYFLNVLNVSDFDEGVYDCVFTSSCGNVTSNPATLEAFDNCPPCPADMVDSATFQWPPDGIVDGADLAFLLGEWGSHPGPPYSGADIVTSRTFQYPPDGFVDGADLAVLLGAWGTCP